MIRLHDNSERGRICALLDRAPVLVMDGVRGTRTTLGALLRDDDGLWEERAALFAALWSTGVYDVGGGAAPRVTIHRRP